MKAAEAIQKTGLFLQEKYKKSGFTYKKSDKCLIRTAGDFSYLVILYSSRGNKEAISLHVDMAIHCDKEIKELHLSVGQLFYFRLLEQEHTVYNIATDDLIAESVKDISSKIDTILIPFIDQLEGDVRQYEQEWLQNGFFANKKGFIGSGLGFVMNLKFIAAFFGIKKAEECLKNVLSTLTPDEKSAFVDALMGKTTYKQFNPSIYGKYSDAKELGLQPN